jgi:hypothetical protein
MPRYKVTIPKKGQIPGVGTGPILKPIYINESVYNNLIGLGYPVKLISQNNKFTKLNITDTNISDKKINDALTKLSENKKTKKDKDKVEKPTNKLPKHSSLVQEVKTVEIVKEEEIIPEEEIETVIQEELIKNEPEITTDVNEEYSETVLEEEITEDEEIVVDASGKKINDRSYSADATYTEDFLTYKNICKKILKNRGIEFESSSTLGDLKQLVLNSNS